jgi:hypothetical protein
MRKGLALLVLAALMVSIAALPATAAKKKKTVTEDWQVTAAPFPGAEDHSDPATECGTQDVNYAIHTFKTPGRGRLETVISGYQGEWDLYVTDSNGNVLGSGVQFMTGTEERVKVTLPAGTEVNIYACNFAGGPTATGTLKYVYKP